MKKVLIIAYYFPPVSASGAMRPLAFCRYLESYGWLPRVLTTDAVSVHPPHPVDYQLMKKLPASVKVDVVPHGNPLRRLVAWRDCMRDVMWAGKDEPVVGQPVRVSGEGSPTARRERLEQLKNLVLDWGFAFPDPQCPWLSPAAAFPRHWPESEIPDVVWATGGPWTSHLVGRRLAQYWRVPYVVDYRDPWTSNPYVSFGSSYLNAKAYDLERSVCCGASRVMTNTHELRVQLEQDYPDLTGKTLTITNGFDPDSFGADLAGVGNVERRLEASGSQLELCHFGTVYGKRTPAVLFQTLVDLHREGRLSGGRLRLRFIGAWEVSEPQCEELAQRLEKVGLLIREPPVPYQECLRQMREADALLVIQPDSPLQIPGKIYEYIATRRPLLLVGGDGATANLVQRHRLGLVCRNDVDEIRGVITDVLEGRRVLSAPPQEELDRFNYRSLTADLAGVLNDVWKEHRESR
ncbi:MAG: glycosyltransferase [Nitrospiraceae bacterium]